jgi:hypothetical protein
MFPSTLSTFSRPATTSKLNNPSHSGLHNTVSSALGQVEAVIGVEGASSVIGTIIGDLRSPGSAGGGHVQTAVKGGTGQTTYTKGDILVAQSSSVLSKLSVGEDGAYLKSNSSVASGVQWGTIPGNPTVRVYPISSVTGISSLIAFWTKPSIISYAVIEVVGGGGAGGGPDGADGNIGAGGGGGGYARKIVLAANLPVSASVVGGGGGVGAANANGGTGATTWFGSVLSATGGAGGTKNVVGAIAVGGVGGIGSSGDINVEGSDGAAANGTTTIAIGGTGGPSHYGGGGKGFVASNSGGDGSAGNVYGGGGGGGASIADVQAGGHGSGGVIIVTEY